jgi:hypothetical protein
MSSLRAYHAGEVYLLISEIFVDIGAATREISSSPMGPTLFIISEGWPWAVVRVHIIHQVGTLHLEQKVTSHHASVLCESEYWEEGHDMIFAFQI